LSLLQKSRSLVDDTALSASNGGVQTRLSGLQPAPAVSTRVPSVRTTSLSGQALLLAVLDVGSLDQVEVVAGSVSGLDGTKVSAVVVVTAASVDGTGGSAATTSSGGLSVLQPAVGSTAVEGPALAVLVVVALGLAVTDVGGLDGHVGHVLAGAVGVLVDGTQLSVASVVASSVVGSVVVAVATDKDVVLGSLLESVVGIVDGGTLGVSDLGHVVTFLLHPVHGDLGALDARLTVVTSSGGLSVAVVDGLGISTDVGHIADEGSHVHLIGSSDGLVDPEPRAHALSVGACGQVGDLEVLELSGGTVVNDGEDDKVIGLDIVLVALVSDTEGTTGNVLTVRSVQVSPSVVPGAGRVSGVGV